MTHTPARRRRGRLASVGSSRRAIRQPVWRWAFLATTVGGFAVLGDGSSALPGTGYILCLVTALTLYAWWPHLRSGKKRRRAGRPARRRR